MMSELYRQPNSRRHHELLEAGSCEALLFPDIDMPNLLNKMHPIPLGPAEFTA